MTPDNLIIDEENFNTFRHQRNAAFGDEIREYFRQNSVEAMKESEKSPIDNAGQ